MLLLQDNPKIPIERETKAMNSPNAGCCGVQLEVGGMRAKPPIPGSTVMGCML